MEQRQITSGDKVQPGNRLVNAIDGGAIGDVMAVRPYDGSLLQLLGEGSQVATFYGGMEMTLPAKSYYGVRAGLSAQRDY